MTSDQLQILEDFYILSEILDDDVDLICDIIKEKIPKQSKRYKRSLIKKFIERPDYEKIHKEVCYILDLPINEIKEFKRIKLICRRIKNNKGIARTSIFDYIKDTTTRKLKKYIYIVTPKQEFHEFQTTIYDFL